MSYRIFLCEFKQESNSFNPILAGFEDFRARGDVLEGDALLGRDKKAGPTLQGMVDILRQHDTVLTGGVRLAAKSGGPVASEVVSLFMEKTENALHQGRWDAVLLSLHGATLSETSGDVCGDILTMVRRVTGEQTVIGVACDMHANVTEQMMRSADFICGYLTYPHLDHYEVGCRAASLTMEKLAGRPLCSVRAALPIIAPPNGYSTNHGGPQALMAHGRAMVESGRIRDFSVFQVQPWLDVSEIASTVLVTADDEQTAMAAAAELAREEFALREELQGAPLWTISRTIQAAVENRQDAPVILVDSADSPNAGACCDSAAVIEALLPYRDTLRCALSVDDPSAVEKAFALGVGGRADFTLGAFRAPALSHPVTVKDALVRSLHSGEFFLGGPAERGQKRNLGPTAVLQAGQLMIVVSTHATNCGDLQFYRSFGIEPTLCRLVSVKACASFRAGYEPISARICGTATPGAAGGVLTDLPFTRLPSPLYPFAEITEEDISAPVRYR